MRRPGAVVVAGLVAAAAALVAGPPAGATAAGRAAGPGTPATPLLSARRVPGWVGATVAAQRAAAAVEAAFGPATLGPAAATSCLVAEQGGRRLVADRPQQPVVPASNMKVLTATAALDVLGPGYRYTTTVLASTAPAGGVVSGDLYLVGGGDPVLRTPQYQATLRGAAGPTTSLPQLAAQVRAAGVTRVTGTVVGDESRYDTARAVAGWKPAYTEEGDAGPLSALEVDDGHHQPLGPLGDPGPFAADTDPAQAAAQDLAGLLLADGVALGAPPVPPPAPPPGTPAPTPAQAAALAAAAEAASARSGTAPPGAVPVTSIESPPLAQLLEAVLAPSDDTAAELITKELGRVRSGQGTTTAGTAAIGADLAADGLPVAGLVAGDGSGLDATDRATCALVAAALDRAGATSALASELAVAGRTGTLAHRLGGPLTAGRVLAKTGTLDDVSALSGFVLPAPAATPAGPLQRPVTFALIVDGAPAPTGVAVGDAVATALAGYPSAPAASAVGPRQ